MVGGQVRLSQYMDVRLGYSYNTESLRDETGSDSGGLTGLGTLPFGDAAEPFSSTVVSLAQTALLPAILLHTITAGAGLHLTKNVSLNAYGAVSLPRSVSRSPGPISAALGSPVTFEVSIEPVIWLGGGFHISFDPLTQAQ